MGARAVVMGLVFAAILGVLIPVIDFKFNNTYFGSQHFAPGAIGVLLVRTYAKTEPRAEATRLN